MTEESLFTIYIDGDAFPNPLKRILLSAINRLELTTIAISNKPITIGPSTHIQYLIVGAGADQADDRIVELVSEEDLVITSDIPLADRIITQNAYVIDHRGHVLDDTNIKGALAMRNLMQSLRDSGETTKGPDPFGPKDVERFANQLNRFLTKRIRQ
ncbi:YaiI/YqxD family protein [bacterium]|jgi:uncharacterized protein|nr:YaiI/YqxD family protein [bacterium]